MKKAILLPVKDFSKGKTRLAPVLETHERQRLANAMFRDVIAALTQVKGADGIFVVTGYQLAAEAAAASGFEVLSEEFSVSESVSVDWASAELAGRGFDLVMRIPADIPLVQATDLDGLLAEVSSAGPFVVMTPSRDGTGTNAIIRNPPALFPSHFGPDSLSLHKEEAARAGARCVLAPNPRIALDIDEPADLIEFLKVGEGTNAMCEVIEMGLHKRFAG